MEDRYSRQTLFREIGADGQERLRNSRVLILGCGALGAAHAETLARAGVGKMRIVDRDYVEYSNLQRQTLFDEDDASDRVPKAAAAQARLGQINSGVEIEAVVADANSSNIEQLIEGCDLVLDGSDNFQIRYLVNDACVKHSKPWIYGAAVSSYGTTMTVLPHQTPCLRCVFEEIPDAGSSPTCDTAGVIMPIITTISAIQTTEAIKLLTGNLSALHGKLINIDIWRNERRAIAIGQPSPDCPACGHANFEFLDLAVQEFAAVLCGRNAVQIAPARNTTLDLEALAQKLMYVSAVSQNEYLVRFAVDGLEMTVFQDARAIIKGTDDLGTARSAYAKYIGS